MAETKLDLIAIGRSSIDLYSNELGVPFQDIKSFGSYVGGSPTNIAVGARRLGLEVALLSPLGDDKTGDFVWHFLEHEGIDTSYIPRKAGKRTSAAVVGMQPPDVFSLVFYRGEAADIALNIDDVLKLPMQDARALEIGGTNLSQDPSRSATFFAAEEAQRHDLTVFFDFDFRADQWHDVRAFGVNVRAILPLVDVAIGTEEEINAAMLVNPDDMTVREQQVSAPEIRGDIDANIQHILNIPAGPEALVVKRGARGASVHLRDGTVINVPGFEVEVVSLLGAGDAFASGLIYGRSKGWDWQKSVRMGNACGAIVVTRQGCANFMGYEAEVLEFIDSRGGF
ncbi:MAG: 5-dehydro-2-deoxygluconokinase [Deinococcota bacterium]